MPKPKHFKSPADFRMWLEQHHLSSKELWVGFYKKSTGRASLTWPESVDEALCFGWIDGLRKTVDDARYAIRFSPRRTGSIWSSVNIRRALELTRQGRMTPAGLKAFEDRNPAKSGQYSFENRPRQLPPRYLKRLKANEEAWAFFQDQPPWYRRTVAWWIISAKKEDTRLRRLDRLIQDSARGRSIPPLTRKPKGQ